MKFWNYLLIPFFALALVGCTGSDEPVVGPDGPNPTPGEKTIKNFYVSLSTTVIKADGVDAVDIMPTVEYSDGTTEVVSEGVTFYTTENKVVTFENLKFSTTEAGKYEYWAAYQTFNTRTKPFGITAIDGDIPERVADPDAASTDFFHKVVFLQFTGTGCGYCPYMINCIDQMLEDDHYGPHIALMVAHTYSSDDPMYYSGRLVNCAPSSYPALSIDLNSRNAAAYYVSTNSATMDRILQEGTDAGISVNSYYDEASKSVVARVTVKAANENNFRVGAVVLEEGIYAKQSDYDGLLGKDTNIEHKATIREYDGMASAIDCTGHDVGHLAKGDYADHLFIIPIKDNWKKENCHMLFFVSSLNGSNSWEATNAIVTESLTEQVPFQYYE